MPSSWAVLIPLTVSVFTSGSDLISSKIHTNVYIRKFKFSNSQIQNDPDPTTTDQTTTDLDPTTRDPGALNLYGMQYNCL